MDLVFGVARPTPDSEDLILRTRAVSRPYPGVPREGDMVDLDDDGLYAAPIDSVLWDADGMVLLVFTELTEVSESDLDDWGFSAGEVESIDHADLHGSGLHSSDLHGSDLSSLSDVDTTFRATPPQGLENLQSVLAYLAPPTLGEVIDELTKYDRSIPVEISFGDEDLDHDIIHSQYPSGWKGEGTEFLDLQRVWIRATETRPIEEPTSNCILCGEEIVMGRYGPRGDSVWAHKASGVRECREDTAAEGD